MKRQRRRHLVISLLIALMMLASMPVNLAAQPPDNSPPNGPPDDPPGRSAEGGAGSTRIEAITGPPGLDGREPPGLERRPDHGLLTAEGARDKARANRGQADPTTKPAGAAANGNERASFMETAEESEPNAPVDGGSFTSVNFSGWIPPDAALAVGPHNMVSATNGALNIYKKNGDAESTGSLNDFFSPLGNVATDGTFDPIAEYDFYLDRFWVLAVSTNTGVSPRRATILLALSDTNDATDDWNFFAFDARVRADENTDDWCDYPQLGLDAQAIYITCNMFDLDDNSFEHVKIRAMTKDQFISGSCCFWWDWWNLREGLAGVFTSFTIQPAHMYDASASDGVFLVNAHRLGDRLHVRHITNVDRCCTPGDQSEPDLNGETIGVGSFDTPPNAEQSGSSTGLDTGDDRLRYAFWQNGRLSTGQNLACPDTDNACIAFTELNVSSFPSMSVINDWYYAGDEEAHYFYPSVDINDNDDKTMVFGRSASDEFASVRYVGIPNSGDCTTCVDGPEVVLHDGENSYVNLDSNGRNRWGDYFDASKDQDGTGIWVMGEYAAATANQWGMEVGLTYTTMDTTAPVTTATLSPEPNENGWNNSDVIVTLSAADAGSGVRTIEYRVFEPGQPVDEHVIAGDSTTVTITPEGTTTLAFRAEDNWGNVETFQQIEIKIDKTDPEISCESPDGQWHATDVSLDCTASDSLSGLANSFADASFALTTNVSDGTEPDDAHTDSRDVADRAGNIATAGPIGGNMVDKKAPEITVTVPHPDGSSVYSLNESVTAEYECIDGGSGVQSCTDTGVDTSAVGEYSVTVTGVDNVGNVDEVVVDYTVAFEICHLYDQEQTHNRRATIPIRIQLCDVGGNNVSAPDITVEALRVEPGNLTPESNANPDGEFTYDPTLGDTGGYIYTLDGRTTGLSAGTEYELVFVAEGDPTEHTAGFVTR